MNDDQRIVYLMRGLPSCGKSHYSRRLVGDSGVVCETDSYFLTEVGDDVNSFDFDDALMDEAKNWNFDNFKRAIHQNKSPIVVDRGNSLCLETRDYAIYAIDRGYKVEIKEPDSEWWQEIKVLLKYKELTWPVLERWAAQLAVWSQSTHRVPVEEILRRMKKWKHGLTLADILDFKSAKTLND